MRGKGTTKLYIDSEPRKHNPSSFAIDAPAIMIMGERNDAGNKSKLVFSELPNISILEQQELHKSFHQHVSKYWACAEFHYHKTITDIQTTSARSVFPAETATTVYSLDHILWDRHPPKTAT